MSRSFKHSPIHGNAKAASDKPFKEAEHRRERHAAKQAIAQGQEPADPKAFGDPWNAPKDGKRYPREITPKLLRK